jgi:hypothetical protein
MKTKTGIALVGVLCSLAIAACGGGGGTKTVAAKPSDSQAIQSILSALRAKYPLPYLTDSSDLRNQIEYAKVQSDPNKIEYLEFLSLSGVPIGTFTIRGQVSAEATRITSPVKDHCYYDDSGSSSGALSCVQDPQPDLTGTFFSQSGGGYFAYLTDGALIQWPASVEFLTSDQPFRTAAPVQLNINENAPISTTTPHVKYSKSGTP